MTTIKKDFIELVSFLEENKEKKVKTILPTIINMVEAKRGRTPSPECWVDDTLIGKYCTYHDKWEPISQFRQDNEGKYPSVCLFGSRARAKAAAAKKASEAALLEKVVSGEVSVEDLPAEKAAIDEQAATVVFDDKAQYFDIKDDLREYFYSEHGLRDSV